MNRRARGVALWLIPGISAWLVLAGPSLLPDRSIPRASAQIRPAKKTSVFRGTYEFGHEVRVFRECNRDTEVWTQDRTGILATLYRELQPVPQDNSAASPLFVVLGGSQRSSSGSGFDKDYSATLSVEHIAYASRKGLDCEVDWSRIVLVAMDAADTWILEVLPGVMRLARRDKKTLVWTLPQRIDTGSTLTFRPVYTQEPEVSLIIEECAWRDNATGTYAGFSATVHLGDEQLYGFAVQGDAELIHQQRGRRR